MLLFSARRSQIFFGTPPYFRRKKITALFRKQKIALEINNVTLTFKPIFQWFDGAPLKWSILYYISKKQAHVFKITLLKDINNISALLVYILVKKELGTKL